MATSPDHKRLRMDDNKIPRIVTHDGSFHADEVLACHMIKLLPEYNNADIIRSRDPTIWSTASILIDVGAEYDPNQNKFDHHQREFTDTFSSQHKTRLSSAGLIYKHFGKRILAQLMNQDITNDQVTLVHNKLYDELIEAFDGIDNGVSRYPTNTVEAYKDATNLSSIVAKLNPFWNENDTDVMTQFKLAMNIVGTHFDRMAKYYATSWLPARSIVLNAMESRHSHYNHGHIIMLPEYAPWKDHICTLEKELSIPIKALTTPIQEGTSSSTVPTNLPLYIVFPDPSGTWRIQAIPLAPNSFENRKPLPSAWRGLRDEQLDAITGVPDGIFIHATGFIGGHKTKEGALKLAELAVHM